MPKKIKVKEKDSHSIRKLDRRIAFTSRIKRSVSNQYDRLKRDDNEEQNVENSNATNYASSKIMRTGDRGARESAYIITGVSKNAYAKAKMKLAERKEEKNSELEKECNGENKNEILKSRNKELTDKSVDEKQDRLKMIKTRESNTENTNTLNKASNIQKYQKQKLIKEKQNFKNIKEHNYKNNGIKTNNNLIKIRTRENINNTSNLSADKNKLKFYNPNEVMKKSKLQNIKQNSTKVKNIAHKAGKAVVNVAKKVVQRNRNDNCIWWRFCFNNTCYYFTNSRNVWICIWISIL